MRQGRDRWQEVVLPAAAPPKPAPGAPCNGCGVCCAAEPCPAGRLFLRRHRGRCPALVWRDDHFRCGLVERPGVHIRWLPAAWEPLARRLLRRWIAAGSGCDSDAVEG